MVFTEITSRKNETIIELSALSQDKRKRDELSQFTFEGIKLFEEALASGIEIKKVFFTKKAQSIYKEVLERAKGAQFFLVSDEVYDKLSGEKSPQGVFVCAQIPPRLFIKGDEFEKAARGGFIILDEIQNPLNIGAVVRSCYAFGFENVVFTSGCADVYGGKTLRAAMGSLFKIKPFFAPSAADAVQKIISLGYGVYCADVDRNSKRLGEISFSPSDSFVIGNEGHGTDEKTKALCTGKIFIPMANNAESLNAASAASVIMWEMKKASLLESEIM